MIYDRRAFLKSSLVASAALTTDTLAIASGPQQAGIHPDSSLSSVRALVFDTFGTVVDWRASVTQEVAQLAKLKGVTIDAAKFADAWRAVTGRA